MLLGRRTPDRTDGTRARGPAVRSLHAPNWRPDTRPTRPYRWSVPRSTPTRRRSVDPTTVALAVLTLGAFGLAATARAAVAWATAGPGSAGRYVDAIAVCGACGAGAGVLLFGATLVLAVRRHRARGLPVVLGFVTLAMVIGAVVAGLAAGRLGSYDAATGLVVLRTALAGLAAASLPALALAALRARTARARRRVA